MKTNNTDQQILSYDAALVRAMSDVEQAWLAHEGTEMYSASERTRFNIFLRELTEELQGEVQAEITGGAEYQRNPKSKSKSKSKSQPTLRLNRGA